MNRIAIVDHHNGNADQKALLDAIRARLGTVPGMLGVFANSPVALRAFLGLQGVAGDGSLSPQTRARIALALAQLNACEYCLAAHTISGRNAGLTGNEMASNRDGTSEDARAAVAVKLARRFSEHRGEMALDELVEARAAGYTDADIVEIITHVGMGLLTSILGKVSGIAGDSPAVPLHRA
jgi:uncharacterized peroxidase-related enzyme